ncbi:MAG: NRDE family protein [Gammaproteobacteria bacterium]|jgi:uncharacterized protein with NRDE domain
MCLLVFAWKVHPEYPLVFAGNRDEFHQRPTRAADYWPDHPGVLAGRDEEAGGTWLGVRKGGHFAVVTNFREAGANTPAGAPSRGELPLVWLEGTLSPDRIAARADQYAGFNLIVGNPEQMWYVSNRDTTPVRIPPGYHGLSNHLLDTPWPKVIRSRERLQASLDPSAEPDVEALFELLGDTTPASDHELPDTGLPRELERKVSAPFVLDPRYGTRCSTVVLMDRQGELFFEERGFAPDGAQTYRRRFSPVTGPPG